MGVTINKKSTTTEPQSKNGQQPKPLGGGGGGGFDAFYWYEIFVIDSAAVEVQKVFSSHGNLITDFHKKSLVIFCMKFNDLLPKI